MDRPALLSLILVGALLPFERIGGFAAFGFNVRLSQVALALAWALFLHACLLGRARVASHVISTHRSRPCLRRSCRHQ